MNLNREPWVSEKRLRKPYRPPKQWATEAKHATVETYNNRKKTHGTRAKNSSYSAVVKDVGFPVMALKAEQPKMTDDDIKGTLN